MQTISCSKIVFFFFFLLSFFFETSGILSVDIKFVIDHTYVWSKMKKDNSTHHFLVGRLNTFESILLRLLFDFLIELCFINFILFLWIIILIIGDVFIIVCFILFNYIFLWDWNFWRFIGKKKLYFWNGHTFLLSSFQLLFLFLLFPLQFIVVLHQLQY